MRPSKTHTVQASGCVPVHDVQTFLQHMHEAGYPLSAKVRILVSKPQKWEHWHIELRRAEAHPRLSYVGYRARWEPVASDYDQLEGLVTVERLAYAAVVAGDDDSLRISQEVGQLLFGGELDGGIAPMSLIGAVPGGCRLK